MLLVFLLERNCTEVPVHQTSFARREQQKLYLTSKKCAWILQSLGGSNIKSSREEKDLVCSLVKKVQGWDTKLLTRHLYL